MAFRKSFVIFFLTIYIMKWNKISLVNIDEIKGDLNA